MKPHFHLIPRNIENTYLLRHHTLPHLGTVWHYHPEIELHYIIRGKGVRFVGDNISNFDAGELLLLGEDLPHMWRCTEEYFRNDPAVTAEAIVIQFLPDFIGQDFLQKWESASIVRLYEKAKIGLIVTGSTKQEIIELMKQTVESEGIKTIILILTMLEILSQSRELHPISSKQTLYQSDKDETDRLNHVIAYTLNNYKNELTLEEIAGVANLSMTSFCRYFKMMTKKTFGDFLTEIRISHAKRLLIENGELTTETVGFECGFNNRSNFFRHFKAITGRTPSEYKKEYSSEYFLINGF
jgi:AraC-like DNA-binding protein